ncbi:MAG: M23 family metallopeptidase [Spirochaetaceae bacterium]|nr:MAG: M23 family metallopeptidase [Spirochaetaceae bacterium]
MRGRVFLKDFIAGLLENRRVVITAAITAGTLLILITVYFLWPEASDDRPPELMIEGIQDNFRYNESASISYYATDKETSLLHAQIAVDGEIVHQTEIMCKGYYGGTNIDCLKLAEGPHRISVRVIDRSFRNNAKEIEVLFFVDRTPPVISTALSRVSVLQGDTAALYLRSSEPLAQVSATLLQRKFYGDVVDAGENIYRCLIPVSIFAPQAKAVILVNAFDQAGNPAEVSTSINVSRQDFIKELIEVPKSKEGLFVDNQALVREADFITKTMQTHTPDQLWSGAFQKPTEGSISSPYGSQRVYTTGLVASCHRGMDIANSAGTTVRAANHGTVIVAAFFILYGNMVMIDHGQGLITMYCHMEALVVKKGDYVLKGETIGFMGDTGLATGPHLHWELRVSMCDANPADLLSSNFENPWKGRN